MKNSSIFKILMLIIVLLIFCNSCNNKDETVTPSLPTTYNFENVDYGDQTQLLSMLSEMKTYLSKGNTSGTVLDANRIKSMYINGSDANFEGDFDDSKQLKNKTFPLAQSIFDALFDSVAAASQSTSMANEGTAGVIVSTDGAKNYLVNRNGVEYTQIIEKGLMGACFYYQATSICLESNKEKGTTTMEHHWDEAFGYSGMPIDFATHTENLLFWANYSHTVNEELNTNEALINAFIKGRHAITHQDLTTRDKAVKEVRNIWEQVAAGTAIHYINSTLKNINDNARKFHALSEAIAFTYALKFNSAKSITDAQIDDILVKIGGNKDFNAMNLYQVTEADLTGAKTTLAQIFNWDSSIADAL